MTVKEQLHQIVDELDDEHAETALAVLVRLSQESPSPSVDRGDKPVSRDITTHEELLAVARPTSADDPLWNIVGLVGDEYEGPTDVSSNKHKYLAEAYADLHEA